LRPVGPDAAVFDAELVAELRPRTALVARAAVGQHSLDLDATGHEPGVGSSEEWHALFDVFVAEDLAVGESTVGVDSGVDEEVAVALLHDRTGTGGTSQDTVTTARWDHGLLLDVDVDQLTGAVGVDATDHPTGGPVHPDEPVQLMADQDGVHGRAR
jgi:hypothetical protein